MVAVRSQPVSSRPLIVMKPLCVSAANEEPAARGADICTVISYFADGISQPVIPNSKQAVMLTIRATWFFFHIFLASIYGFN